MWKIKFCLAWVPRGTENAQHFGLKVLNDDDDDDGRTAGSIPRRDAAVRNLQKKGLRPSIRCYSRRGRCRGWWSKTEESEGGWEEAYFEEILWGRRISKWRSLYDKTRNSVSKYIESEFCVLRSTTQPRESGSIRVQIIILCLLPPESVPFCSKCHIIYAANVAVRAWDEVSSGNVCFMVIPYNKKKNPSDKTKKKSKNESIDLSQVRIKRTKPLSDETKFYTKYKKKVI